MTKGKSLKEIKVLNSLLKHLQKLMKMSKMLLSLQQKCYLENIKKEYKKQKLIYWQRLKVRNLENKIRKNHLGHVLVD